MDKVTPFRLKLLAGMKHTGPEKRMRPVAIMELVYPRYDDEGFRTRAWRRSAHGGPLGGIRPLMRGVYAMKDLGWLMLHRERLHYETWYITPEGRKVLKRSQAAAAKRMREAQYG